MITLKQHAISVAAIFLALAIGVVLGSQTLASGLLHGLRDDTGALRRGNEELQGQNNQLRNQLAAADGFDTAVAGRVVRDALANRSVVLFTTPDADPSDVDGVARRIESAGGTVSGRLALTEAFWDPSNADRLRTTVTNLIPVGVQLQTGAVDQGSLAGDFLGAVLQLHAKTGQPQTTPQELELVLNTLRSGGFVGNTSVSSSSVGNTGPVQPGHTAVVVTGDGGSADGNSGAVVARFAAALRPRGLGAVLAGHTRAADGNAPIAVVRADSALASAVSTVDDVDRAAGRITVALALREQIDGGAGRYGTGSKATSVTVGTTSAGG